MPLTPVSGAPPVQIVQVPEHGSEGRIALRTDLVRPGRFEGGDPAAHEPNRAGAGSGARHQARPTVRRIGHLDEMAGLDESGHELPGCLRGHSHPLPDVRDPHTAAPHGLQHAIVRGAQRRRTAGRGEGALRGKEDPHEHQHVGLAIVR